MLALAQAVALFFSDALRGVLSETVSMAVEGLEGFEVRVVALPEWEAGVAFAQLWSGHPSRGARGNGEDFAVGSSVDFEWDFIGVEVHLVYEGHVVGVVGTDCVLEGWTSKETDILMAGPGCGQELFALAKAYVGGMTVACEGV